MSILKDMLLAFGASTIAVSAIFFCAVKTNFIPNSTVKVSGVVDRIGAYGGTVFLLKNNKTTFYIEDNTRAALTKPGDQVAFTVTTMKNELGLEAGVNRSSFVNLNLKNELKK